MARQNNLQISLNNLSYNQADESESILNVNTVSTGLRLSCDDDEHHSSLTTASGSAPSPPPTILDNLCPEIEHQNEEFDRYLRIQQEQFVKGARGMLQRHLSSFASMVEAELSRKLRDKDLEIESMDRKNRELAGRIRQAAAEAQSWQQRAKYNESIVHALQSSLQQMMVQGAAVANNGREGCGDSEVVDSASSFRLNSEQDGGHRQAPLKRACKACKGSRECFCCPAGICACVGAVMEWWKLALFALLGRLRVWRLTCYDNARERERESSRWNLLFFLNICSSIRSCEIIN